MDFYPRAGQLSGSVLDLTAFANYVDYDKDFNGNDKGSVIYRGAYAGEGSNPGWKLRDAMKVGGPSNPAGDISVPSTPSGVSVTVN